jgi:putative ABC transport system permease protein
LINKLVIENLKHRPVRTLLSVLAIAIEVTMILTLVGLSRGMLDDSARRARGVGADIWIRSNSRVSPCRCAKSRATIVPRKLCQGPAPIRSLAFTAGFPPAAEVLK